MTPTEFATAIHKALDLPECEKMTLEFDWSMDKKLYVTVRYPITYPNGAIADRFQRFEFTVVKGCNATR